MDDGNNLNDEWKMWHGFAGNGSWPLPKCVARSDEPARKDQGNLIEANEFLDDETVLREKMELIAQFISLSQFCCAYTGAGLSRASGIPDYATKAKDSVLKTPVLKSNFDAEPTYAHCVLTAMERAGKLHHWVQQNHDGLPQKAGFPQEKINEIHGAWYDPSNRVVQFNEGLRSDLYDWLLEAEQRTDLCLCLGTSLSGMNADRVAKTTAQRSNKRIPETLGTVVINLQQTSLDSIALIRVWATLDDAFRMLVKLLELPQDIKKIDVPIPPGDVYEVPYNAEGYLDTSILMTWDLRPGSIMIIPNRDAKNYGCVGKIDDTKKDGHYGVIIEEEDFRSPGIKKNVKRMLGKWWVDCALRGSVLRLPVVNVGPTIKPKE